MNPYLNTPPTKLKRDMEREKDPEKREQMKDALNAWRITVPGPFRKGDCTVSGSTAKEILRVAREVLAVTPVQDLAAIVRKHWKGPWSIVVDENLVNITIRDKPLSTMGLMSHRDEYEQALREHLLATNRIDRDAKRRFNVEDSSYNQQGVFLVSDDFLGSRVRKLEEKRGRR